MPCTIICGGRGRGCGLLAAENVFEYVCHCNQLRCSGYFWAMEQWAQFAPSGINGERRGDES